MTFQKARLIVGLGNPDSKYERTRHNIGRRVVGQIQSLGQYPLPGVEFFVTKGYMNTSGNEVARFMAYKNIHPQETLIVFDDFEIPLARIRIRLSGSDGGHNGLKSVIEQLGTDEVPRVRVGIGPVPLNVDPAEYVLKPFSREEEKQLETIVPEVKKAVDLSISQGIEVAMNQFNGRTF